MLRARRQSRNGKGALRRALLVLPCLLALAAATTPEVAAETWHQVLSPNFRVVGNVSAKRVERVAFEFEEVRRAIDLFFPGLAHSPAPLTIFAVATEADVERLTGLRRRNVGGFFYQDDLNSTIVARLDVDTEHSFGLLYHEYFHAVTRHSLPGLPLWLNEGLAEIWSNSVITDKSIRLGLVNRSYMKFLGQTKMANLEEIVEPDLASKAYRNRGDRHVFYAHAWALTHYFLMGDGGERWPKVMAYLDAIASGAPEKESWNRFLGSRKAVTRDLWKYLNGGRFSMRTLKTAGSPGDVQYDTKKLSEAELQALQGNYLATANPTLARNVLAKATDAPDAPALAYEALGFIALQRSLYKEARQNFERALELDPSSYKAHFHLATLVAREAKEGWQELYVEHLLAAAGQADWFAPASYQLARHYAQIDDTPARALVLAERATRRARGSAHNHVLVAHLLHRKGDDAGREASVRFALHLATSAASPSIANRVCWDGSLFGLAEHVYPACERAVRRQRRSAYLDSRGVARALRGDLEGARSDFAEVVEKADLGKATLETRRSWIAALEQGQNPIDAFAIEALLTQRAETDDDGP